MHRDVFGRHFVAFKLHHHTNPGTVQIGGQPGTGCKPLEAAKAHVLADLADQTLAHIFQRRAKTVLRIGQHTEPSHVRRSVFARQRSRRICQRKKAVVLGHEVGLAIDFDHRATVSIAPHCNHSFSSYPAGGLARLGTQLHTQKLFRLGHIALGFGQGAFAFHHWRIGLAAQLRYHAGTDCSHLISPYLIRKNYVMVLKKRGIKAPFLASPEKHSGRYLVHFDKLV